VTIPFEVLAGLVALPLETRRGRWREGMEAWEALGNSEQALSWARLGGKDPEIARLSEAWDLEAKRQRGILEANLRSASLRLSPPALPSLAWNEAKDLASGVTWALVDSQVELVEMPSLRRLPTGTSGKVVGELEALAAKGQPLVLAPSVGAGLLARLLEAQPPMFLTMRPALYVVEPSPGRFRMLARLFDLSALLAADHLLWFVGEDWAGRLSSFLRANPGIPPAVEGRVLPGGPDGNLLRKVFEEASLWRQGEVLRLSGEIRRAYAGWVPAAFAGGGRPRILLVTSRYTTVLQYVTRDLERAFREEGCETLTVLERRDCQWSAMMEVRQKVASWKPDLVVFLDHLRWEFGDLFPPELPYVCWVQDRLPCLFERSWIVKLGARDLTFSMWPVMTRDLLAAGYPEVFPLPVAGDDSVYRLPEGPPPPGLRCDVAFVSNLQVPRPLPSYPGLVEEAERILRTEGIGYRDPVFYDALLARLERDLALTVASGDRQAVLHRLSFDVERWVQRAEPVRWARDMGLDVRVWGRGWADSPEFAPLARGVAAPGEALRDLYAAARIQLHMNSDTNMHARVFECLLSGGFILAWAHPSDGEPGGLGEALEIGREVETFSGREDFERKVRRYLADEEARRAVSASGRARVLAEHTMRHRAGEILRRVRGRVSC